MTHDPDPADVRPLNILIKSLDWVISKYAKTKDYNYTGDQLRSIRQDLTIQNIKNNFTLKVY